MNTILDFFKKQSTDYICMDLFEISILHLSMSNFYLMPHCLDCCNFIVNLEIT